MMKNFMTSGALSKGKKPEGDLEERTTAPFPGEEEVMSIHGGSVPHESLCKLKLMSWAVNAVSPATPEYLWWSKSSINFDLTDHPDCVLKLGRFPLIVDPLVRTTRLTKALRDWGIGLNLMYLDTFDWLGLGWDLHKTNPHPFYGVVLSK
jgi:hypothetical protein